MSRVEHEETREDGIRSIVYTNDGKWYCVDTADTFDCGPETMVFPFNARTQSCTSARELYVEHYHSMEEGYEKHREIAAALEQFLK